jgi:hypothetical protein
MLECTLAPQPRQLVPVSHWFRRPPILILGPSGGSTAWKSASTMLPALTKIMVAIAVTGSGRPLARLGGLTKDQIKGEEGL